MNLIFLIRVLLYPVDELVNLVIYFLFKFHITALNLNNKSSRSNEKHRAAKNWEIYVNKRKMEEKIVSLHKWCQKAPNQCPLAVQDLKLCETEWCVGCLHKISAEEWRTQKLTTDHSTRQNSEINSHRRTSRISKCSTSWITKVNNVKLVVNFSCGHRKLENHKTMK